MQFIAFYLPQYHPIPENDRIYGPGFTEWDNVRSAVPLFDGHYEPHVPHEKIGYYSLLDRTFLEFQHAFAWAHGVRAFCYYYYNFAGRTLLEKPLRTVLRSREIRNSFCLCWVHTDWYDNHRAPEHPFIRQEYSAQNALSLCLDLEAYFQDPRYIRIDGRPLLLIWAPERHPMLPTYTEVLRYTARKHGFPDLFLAGVEAYRSSPPSLYGLDCMVEFAPDWRRENHVSAEGERPVRIDYEKTLAFMLSKPVPDYLRLRCAFPGWDNTPRRGREGIACVGTDPGKFEESLRALCTYTQENLPPSLQYVFVNAWNEWGEGCHLEPDQKHGLTYVQIMQRTFRDFQTPAA